MTIVELLEFLDRFSDSCYITAFVNRDDVVVLEVRDEEGCLCGDIKVLE